MVGIDVSHKKIKGKLFKYLTLLNLSFVAVPEFLPTSNAGLFSEMIFIVFGAAQNKSLISFICSTKLCSLLLCSTKLFFLLFCQTCCLYRNVTHHHHYQTPLYSLKQLFIVILKVFTLGFLNISFQILIVRIISVFDHI